MKYILLIYSEEDVWSPDELNVANLEEAVAVAEKIPGTTRGTTEIRPIVELPGLP